MRFQFSFAVGAVVATIHDLLVTLAFLAFFRYDLSLNVIAAILTITGYSVNDTIVIFDRVRENMRGMRRDNLEQIVNVSVNQTLGRTIITAGTALLSVLALYLFGGEVLHGFAFTMLVGIITGTYSSVFIAAAIVLIWQGKKPVKAMPAAPAGRRGAGAEADAPTGVVGRSSGDCADRCAAGRHPGTDRVPAGLDSTAHLLIGARLFRFSDPGGVFAVLLQLGTILAAMWLYRAKIARMVRGLPSDPDSPSLRADDLRRVPAGGGRGALLFTTTSKRVLCTTPA